VLHGFRQLAARLLQVNRSMKVHAGTLPFWMDTAALPTYPTLARDEAVDVAVIGGGM